MNTPQKYTVGLRSRKSFLFSQFPWTKAATLLAVFLCSICLQEANGLDLNPLKNLKAKTDDNKVDQMAMGDAATGTITALVDPMSEKREPTSCNDIMARAVVVASEEKEAAIAARDAALSEAASAKAKAEELATKIDAALAEARNATIEFEAMKLLTDRLVQEARHEAASKIEIFEKQSSFKLEEVKENFEKEKTELELKYEAMLEKVEEKAKEQRENDQARMIAIEKRAAEEVMKLKEQLQTLEKHWQEKMLKAVKDFDEQSNQIKKESKEAIQTALDDAQVAVRESLERSSQIEKDAKVAMAEANRRAEVWVEEIQMKSTERLEMLKRECQAELLEKDKSYQNMVDFHEKQNAESAKQAATRQQELQSILESQRAVIQSLEADKAELKHDVSNLNEQLKYWIDLHDSQGFVNTTIVMLESKAFLEQLVQVGQDTTRRLYDLIVQEGAVASQKVDAFITPYRHKIRYFYHDRLEKHVHNTLVPFYQTYILPNYSNMRKHVLIPLGLEYQKAMTLIIRYLTNIKFEYFERASLIVQTCATGTKTFLLSDHVQNKTSASFLPTQSFIMFLSRIENDPKDFVTTALKIILFFILYKLRKVVSSMIFWCCSLPLKVTWYFCPLKYFFRRHKHRSNNTPDGTATKNDIASSKAHRKPRVKKELEHEKKRD